VLTRSIAPFLIPAHQTGRAELPASGFPAGLLADSQTQTLRPLQPAYAQGAEHPFLGELAGAVPRHIGTPPQKVPHLVIDLSLHPRYAFDVLP
jgi:hypothetical protein